MPFKPDYEQMNSLSDYATVCSHAMILAAGYGKRLHPLTLATPKPLIKIQNESLLEYHLRHLKNADFDTVVVNTHYLSHQIHMYMDENSPLSYHISHEEELLETGGGLAKALHFFNKPFFSINSDAYTTGDLTQCYNLMRKAFSPEKMDVLLLLAPKKRVMGYESSGDFFIDASQENKEVLTRKSDLISSVKSHYDNFNSEQSELFSNKDYDEHSILPLSCAPIIFRDQNLNAPYVYVGIQILHPKIFEKCKMGAFSITELWKNQQNKGRLYGIVDTYNVWFDTGNHNGLSLAQKAKIETNRVSVSSTSLQGI